MRLVVPVMIGGLAVSSVSHAQDLNTPRINDDRAMAIDSFPRPSETGSILAPPGPDTEYELPAPLEDTFKLHSNPELPVCRRHWIR